MRQDQSYEQGFEVNRAFVYDAFITGDNYLNLSDKWLTSIPDLCVLIKQEDHAKVHYLNLATNKIRIIDQDLSCLERLRVLNLSYNQIIEVVKLGDLPNLQELLLHKNQLTTTNNLPNFPALKSLNLAYNNLKKVSWLEKFTQLTNLELQHNEIIKILGLDQLTELQQLRLEFNRLKELPFLEALKELNLITTEGNDLQAWLQEKLEEIQNKYRQIIWTGGSWTGS